MAWILLAVIPSVVFDAEASASASKFTRFSTLSWQIEKGAHLGLERPWTPVFRADHGLYIHHGHFCSLFREQAPRTTKLITMPSMVADPRVRPQNSLEATTGTASATTDMGNQSPGGRIASQSTVFLITFNTRAYGMAAIREVASFAAGMWPNSIGQRRRPASVPGRIPGPRRGDAARPSEPGLTLCASCAGTLADFPAFELSTPWMQNGSIQAIESIQNTSGAGTPSAHTCFSTSDKDKPAHLTFLSKIFIGLQERDIETGPQPSPENQAQKPHVITIAALAVAPMLGSDAILDVRGSGSGTIRAQPRRVEQFFRGQRGKPAFGSLSAGRPAISGQQERVLPAVGRSQRALPFGCMAGRNSRLFGIWSDWIFSWVGPSVQLRCADFAPG